MPTRAEVPILAVSMGRLVTTGNVEPLTLCHPTRSLENKWKEKYDWDVATLDSIDWTTIGRIRRKQSAMQRMHSCKLMHGWLPTMNKNFRFTTKKGPGCPCPNETNKHVYVCSSPIMARKRREIIAALRKKGLKRVPQHIGNAIANLIAEHFQEPLPSAPLYDQPIRDAIANQRRVGLTMILWGFIVEGW